MLLRKLYKLNTTIFNVTDLSLEKKKEILTGLLKQQEKQKVEYTETKKEMRPLVIFNDVNLFPYIRNYNGSYGSSGIKTIIADVFGLGGMGFPQPFIGTSRIVDTKEYTRNCKREINIATKPSNEKLDETVSSSTPTRDLIRNYFPKALKNPILNIQSNEPTFGQNISHVVFIETFCLLSEWPLFEDEIINNLCNYVRGSATYGHGFRHRGFVNTFYNYLTVNGVSSPNKLFSGDRMFENSSLAEAILPIYAQAPVQFINPSEVSVFIPVTIVLFLKEGHKYLTTDETLIRETFTAPFSYMFTRKPPYYTNINKPFGKKHELLMSLRNTLLYIPSSIVHRALTEKLHQLTNNSFSNQTIEDISYKIPNIIDYSDLLECFKFFSPESQQYNVIKNNAIGIKKELAYDIHMSFDGSINLPIYSTFIQGLNIQQISLLERPKLSKHVIEAIIIYPEVLTTEKIVDVLNQLALKQSKLSELYNTPTEIVLTNNLFTIEKTIVTTLYTLRLLYGDLLTEYNLQRYSNIIYDNIKQNLTRGYPFMSLDTCTRYFLNNYEIRQRNISDEKIVLLFSIIKELFNTDFTNEEIIQYLNTTVANTKTKAKEKAKLYVEILKKEICTGEKNQIFLFPQVHTRGILGKFLHNISSYSVFDPECKIHLPSKKTQFAILKADPMLLFDMTMTSIATHDILYSIEVALLALYRYLFSNLNEEFRLLGTIEEKQKQIMTLLANFNSTSYRNANWEDSPYTVRGRIVSKMENYMRKNAKSAIDDVDSYLLQVIMFLMEN